MVDQRCHRHLHRSMSGGPDVLYAAAGTQRERQRLDKSETATAPSAAAGPPADRDVVDHRTETHAYETPRYATRCLTRYTTPVRSAVRRTTCGKRVVSQSPPRLCLVAPQSAPAHPPRHPEGG
uniref:UL149 n=1 Tax=Human cytomegalovirus TaxID=10359 RepID=Q6PMP6_HCMV|nr:UL149 [Human betaherpesvirus 5]AAY17954.1 UL149 [Human betaherpesvirus 5]